VPLQSPAQASLACGGRLRCSRDTRKTTRATLRISMSVRSHLYCGKGTSNIPAVTSPWTAVNSDPAASSHRTHPAPEQQRNATHAVVLHTMILQVDLREKNPWLAISSDPAAKPQTSPSLHQKQRNATHAVVVNTTFLQCDFRRGEPPWLANSLEPAAATPNRTHLEPQAAQRQTCTTA
jgi:hypothetical protein